MLRFAGAVPPERNNLHVQFHDDREGRNLSVLQEQKHVSGLSPQQC